MRFSMLLLLLSSVALAQQGVGIGNGGLTRSNDLRIPAYRTPGNGLQSYFVNGATGNDTFNCQVAATPCLTIQGALNQVPKLLRDQVTVNVAAGTYAGFTVSAFKSDTSIQQATGGLLIDGVLANSTLATGSATGTAAGAGQLAGSGSTFGVLCDSGATWTVNDLRGRFITTASPTNAQFVVSSNTATCITIVGTWALPVAGTTTYTIQDPSVIINAGVAIPANPVNAGAANRAAIEFTDNTILYRTNCIVLRNMRLIPPTPAAGIETVGGGAYQFVNLQVRPSGIGATGFFINTIVAMGAPSNISVSKCDVSLSSNTGFGVSSSSGLLNVANTLFRNSGTSATGIFVGIGNSSVASLTFQTSEVQGIGGVGGAAIQITSGLINNGFNGNRLSCANSNGTGIIVGNTVLNASGTNSVVTPITTTDISTCGTAISVGGPSTADVASMTGSVSGAAFVAYSGGVITFAKASTTITAGTSEINLDSGGLTAAFADVPAGTCVATAAPATRVCGR